jgi:hypothetical protein
MRLLSVEGHVYQAVFRQPDMYEVFCGMITITYVVR